MILKWNIFYSEFNLHIVVFVTNLSGSSEILGYMITSLYQIITGHSSQRCSFPYLGIQLKVWNFFFKKILHLPLKSTQKELIVVKLIRIRPLLLMNMPFPIYALKKFICSLRGCWL